MYERHWNLSSKPFQNDFDPQMFFPSAMHEEALTRLLYAFSEEKSLMLLTGPPGAGKSYVARIFASECERRGVASAYVGIPDSDPLELIVQIGRAYGLAFEHREKYRMIDTLVSHIQANSGGRGLLVLDEVQDLREPGCLEEVRLLTSLTHGHRRIFTIILVGGQSMREFILKDEALASRIEIAHNLQGMNVEETIRYVTQRLENAGRRETVFSPDALEAMHSMTGGLPRLINTLCDFSLFAAAGRKLEWVGLEVVEEARVEIGQFMPTRAMEATL
jgi:general secretion pathway protein A